MSWLEHFLGFDMSGNWYGFWSGFGSDLGELAIVGALVAMVRKHVCHVKGCWRIGRLPIEGTSWIVCRKHHPDDAPTAAEALQGGAN
jgi:hypothetical protein